MTKLASMAGASQELLGLRCLLFPSSLGVGVEVSSSAAGMGLPSQEGCHAEGGWAVQLCGTDVCRYCPDEPGAVEYQTGMVDESVEYSG